jgi:hypothetical protein
MEGYEEIEIYNSRNKLKVIKSCNNCKYQKRVIWESASIPVFRNICDFDFQNDLSVEKRKLHRNIHGYLEPLGFDGEECPFHKQLLREKSINKLLEE